MVGDAYTFIGLERTSKLGRVARQGSGIRSTLEDFISKIRTATAPDVST